MGIRKGALAVVVEPGDDENVGTPTAATEEVPNDEKLNAEPGDEVFWLTVEGAVGALENPGLKVEGREAKLACKGGPFGLKVKEGMAGAVKEGTEEEVLNCGAAEKEKAFGEAVLLLLLV